MYKQSDGIIAIQRIIDKHNRDAKNENNINNNNDCNVYRGDVRDYFSVDYARDCKDIHENMTTDGITLNVEEFNAFISMLVTNNIIIEETKNSYILVPKDYT